MALLRCAMHAVIGPIRILVFYKCIIDADADADANATPMTMTMP